MSHNSPTSVKTPVWRLLLPLIIQTGLVLAIPAQALYTQITGKTIVLQTVPVDPYDFLRGYSQTLSYDISRIDNLQKLAGWQDLVKQPNSNSLATGTKLYVILQAPASDSLQPPQAWKPVRVSGDRPTNLPANQVALQGRYTGGLIEYGVETYYMPESRQQEINRDIVQAQRGQKQSVVVEVKVNAQGYAVPMSFWVNQRNYRF